MWASGSRWIRAGVLLSLVLAVLGGAMARGEVVHFPDPNLEQAVSEELGVPVGEITVADMETLTRLLASYRGIVLLDGLEYAINLTSLLLCYNEISDLEPLSDLTNLTELLLCHNKISDISPLGGLTNLTRLDLSNWVAYALADQVDRTDLGQPQQRRNQISDISPLAHLVKLTELRLDDNKISEISPLSGLTNLTRLCLQYNEISDISPLVENSDAGGLGHGDYVIIYSNDLDLTPGSTAMTDIQTLIDRGVEVKYRPPITWPFIEPGLHMLSVPAVPEDASPENVFRRAVGEDTFVIHEYVDGQYVMPTEIDPGRGYWLYAFEELPIGVPREMPEGEYMVALDDAGWHQVSTPKWLVGWQDVSFQKGEEERSLDEAIGAGWIEPYAFRYSLGPGDYVAIELPTTKGGINPWTGYFLKTREPDLTMVLPLDKPHFPGAPETVLSMSEVPTGLRPPTAPSLSSLSAELLTAAAYPNPVRGEGVSFTLQGPLASEWTAIRVRVHDLSGRLVYEDESAGASLLWDTLGPSGAPVASGVYLYTVEAKLDGEWVSAGVDRLLILR